MAFHSPDPSSIRLWGETCVHNPLVGSGATVKCVRVEDQEEVQPGAEVIVFGTIADSGFAQQPVLNDRLVVDGINYRIFKVAKDWAGGSQATAGLFLHLSL